MKAIKLGVTLLALVLAGQASAHHLWLEADGPTARLYFGEFGENLREASPGSLDRLQPTARLVTAGKEQPLTLEKSATGFAVAGGPLGAADAIVAEDIRYPVFSHTKDGVTTRSIYWPAARLVGDETARPALLALDIVPAGSDAFGVYFKGKPLTKAKVSITTSSGWGRELRTADDGTVKLGLPWRGPYVLEVHHSDRTAGKRGDEAYDVINYVTSLTVTRTQGLEPPPALPPAAPHK